MPTLLVVAGPNGCGKSTLTRTSGFSGIEMIDPDALVRSMSSGEATREALRRRKRALGEKRSYLVKTTLAGAGILRHMEAAVTTDATIASSRATGETVMPGLLRFFTVPLKPRTPELFRQFPVWSGFPDAGSKGRRCGSLIHSLQNRAERFLQTLGIGVRRRNPAT